MDWLIPLAFAVAEGLKRQPEGFLSLLFAGRAILDGDVGGTCLHAEHARSGGEANGGTRAASGKRAIAVQRREPPWNHSFKALRATKECVIAIPPWTLRRK
jgi:hypothetical protein